MDEPLFLSLEEILRLHKAQIDRYGGSHGVRDMGLLDSALASPQASFSGVYLHSSLFEMAAAYLFHLVLNHPFLDGNKRIGVLAADVFLKINGVELHPDPLAFERLVLETAQGKVDKSFLAGYLRKNSRKIRSRS